jgi:hypothetical protein
MHALNHDPHFARPQSWAHVCSRPGLLRLVICRALQLQERPGPHAPAINFTFLPYKYSLNPSVKNRGFHPPRARSAASALLLASWWGLHRVWPFVS